MGGLLAIVRRDLAARFRGPAAWLLLACWCLLGNLAFCWSLPDEPGTASVVPLHLLALRTASWLLVLLGPALAMEGFERERERGTLALLLASPLDDRTLVLAKFCSAWAMILVLVAATATWPLTLAAISEVAWGQTACGYLGLVLFAGLLAAVGTWIGLIAEGPVVAWVLTFAVVAVLHLVGMRALLEPEGDGLLHHLGRAIGLGPRLGALLDGRLRLHDVGFFLAGITACLLLAGERLAARRRHG